MKNPWIHKNGKAVLDKRSKQYKGPRKRVKKVKRNNKKGESPSFLLLNSKNALKLWKTPRKRC